jgi:integrase
LTPHLGDQCRPDLKRPNGGPDFRLHDWRHHWASWMVMEGADLETIRKLGGWTSLDMVLRYAAVSTEHMAEAVARLK